MKSGLSLLIAACLFSALAPAGARAQSEDDYKGWMKQVSDTNGKLKKELKDKSPDASADATKIAALFAQMGDFWQKRNAPDAVDFAAKDASSYKKISTLATDAKFEDASAELKSADASCSGCHKVHRKITIHGAEIK